mmetsp:Transcript_27155/g.108758  ORF Transcript_27155/g.108758 Transcript_27155/m.108758 type:complete len:152 (-) Transcript_27155:243-698(-)
MRGAAPRGEPIASGRSHRSPRPPASARRRLPNGRPSPPLDRRKEARHRLRSDRGRRRDAQRSKTLPSREGLAPPPPTRDRDTAPTERNKHTPHSSDTNHALAAAVPWWPRASDETHDARTRLPANLSAVLTAVAAHAAPHPQSGGRPPRWI